MTYVPRKSHQWCARHWEEFRSLPRNSRALASLRLIEELLRRTGPLTERALLLDMASADQPVCCRLGTLVVNNILAEVRELTARDAGQIIVGVGAVKPSKPKGEA